MTATAHPRGAEDLERGPSPASRTRDRLTAVRRWFGSGIERCRTERTAGLVAAISVVVAWALTTGMWMPRGPLTTGQALWSLVLSIAVGVVVGMTARRGWALVAAPVLFVAVVEVMRVDLVGPTVDRPQLSAYGLLALAVGRGFHGLVSVLPMVWGAALAVALLSRGHPPIVHRRPRLAAVRRGLRHATVIIVGVALVAMGAVLARPASTSAITGPDGRPLPGSVAELTSVRLNGRPQPMMIRGHDTANPVLLFLAGGPGGSELGAMRRHLPDLERHFTVVTWDQRGTGKAYPHLDPTDTIAVTDHLRTRFGQDRIHLLGQSWGSTLGVLAVQQAPDRYEAFIGVGQMVSQTETDRIFYEDTLTWARESGRDGLVAELTSIGPPPYDSMLSYETALSHEHDVYPYDRTGNHEGIGGFSENFLVREYSLVEQVHLLAGFMDTFSVLYPQLRDIDFRRTATRLDVPVFFVQGAHEAAGRSRLFEEWYPTLEAPSKDVIYLDTSGHRPLFEQPEEFVTYMAETVLGGPGT
jgi:proline iminopeptidase